ncbi:MAG: hypothetical protein COA65_08580 [Rhodospirillaceae bacterium]|nr:MAG: hypothetical protein COA65_08580 [Rhodospirillaceae bacterium]
MNVLRNLTDLYGWKHIIFSPETGNAPRVLNKLIKIHSGKEMEKKSMTKDEFYKWTAELEDKYLILELKDEELYLDTFIKEVKTILRNEQIDTVTLDPFNELRHSFEKHGGREDKYLEDRLTEIRRIAMDYNVHINIAAHARSDRSGQRGTHPKAPSMYEFSGGEAFANKAMNVIIVHRPLTEIDEHGNPTGRLFPHHNQSEIGFLKIKPEEVGKRGSVNMWYNSESSRFYEKKLGQEVYCETL